MTPEQLREHWDRAQELEAAGALDEARAGYSAILAASPRQLMVQLQLSALEQSAGRYRASRSHVLEAAKTIGQTQRWEGLPYVSLRLLAFDERELAYRLVRGADWSSAQVLSQVPVLSQHLSLCGHDDEALRLLDAAAPRVRPSHLLEYSRADALRHQGRTEEASAAYERCIALAPSFPYAHWSLAYHAPSPSAGSRLARIRKALDDRQQDAAGCAHLHYALFKELDTAGEIDAAWVELRAGAELMRGLQAYDAAAEQAGIEALLAGSNRRPKLARPADAGARVPIFIVGMPRTGTTVLERILGNHSQVASAGELNAFQHALSFAANRFVSTPQAREDVEALRTIDFNDVGTAYLRRTGSLYGTHTHLVDKNPLNVFNAAWIARALPQARILCLVRDPMDACFSNLKELFSGDTYGYSYDLRELAAHALRFRALAAHWERTLPGRFMTVSYEALVAAPEATSADVLRFCGLDAEAGVADITRNTTSSSTASSSQVREPIHARGIGAWRRYERQLAPLADALGEGRA